MIGLNTIASSIESLIFIHIALEMHLRVPIDDLVHFIGYSWFFCHSVGASYSFFGYIIDSILEICPVTKVFLNDGTKPLGDTADVWCGNIGILHV